MNTVNCAIKSPTYKEISDVSVLSRTPLVSVRMSTYNHEFYIARAIEGVLIQECEFSFELIIGEDCSTDRTLEIVMTYQSRRPDIIRVIAWNKNVGARNNGRKMSELMRGKYIAWCEGDDYWTDSLKLQKQVEIFEKTNKTVLVVHNANVVKADRTFVRVYSPNMNGIVKPDYIISNGGSAFATNTMMMKACVYNDKPKWFDRFPTGDSAVVNLAVNRGDTVFINQVMSTYREGIQGSWSSRQFNLKIRSRHLIQTIKAYFILLICEKKYILFYSMRILNRFILLAKVLIYLNIHRHNKFE